MDDLQTDSGSALRIAAMHGDLARVHDLLAQGVPVDAVSAQGWTPLMLASKYGRIEMVRLLYDLGAKIETQNAHHETALRYAVERGHIEIVVELFDRGVACTPSLLERAISNRNIELVEILLDHGADPNESDSRYFTPLMLAVREIGNWFDFSWIAARIPKRRMPKGIRL